MLKNYRVHISFSKDFRKRVLFILTATLLVLGDFFVFSDNALAATTWSVSVDSAGSCTIKDTNCATIQAAVDAASSGDTINVAAGTYNENLSINKPLILNGAQTNVDPRPNQGGRSGDESIIDAQEANSSVIRISASDVEINGFTITGGTGDMVEEDDSANNLLFQYNILYDDLESAGDEAIQIKYSTGVVIQYNYAYNIIQDAFNLSSSSNGAVKYNEAHDIHSENAAIYCYDATDIDILGNLVYNVPNNDGIKLGDSDDGSTGGTVSDNIVHDAVEDGVTIYASGVAVDNNTIYNCGSENGALYLYGADDTTVTNNKIYDNNAIGLLIHNSDNVTVTGNVIYNNDDTDDNKYADSSGIWLTSSATNITINNNSIYANADYELKNENSSVVDASNNYWGTVDKSSIQSKISTNVAFEPYYIDAGTTILSNEPVSTVYVDDDYTDGSSGDYYFGYNAFATIQEGINGVDEGGTVNIAAGTYVQTEDLVMDKQITLIGISNSEPTIQFDGKCDNISIQADNVILENLRVYKTNTEVGWQGLPTCAANTLLDMPKAGPPEYLSIYEGLSVDNCVFEGGRYAMYINSKGDFNVEDSEFINSGGDYSTIHIAAFEGTVNILRNTFGAGLERAIVIEPGPDEQILYGGTINIKGNTVTGKKSFLVYNHWADASKLVDINISNNSLSEITDEGILFFVCGEVDLNKVGSVDITNNKIFGTKYGIRIDSTSCPGWGIPTNVNGSLNLSVHSNIFMTNSDYGILNEVSSLVEAERNYWGDASGPGGQGPGEGNVMSANVEYSPWYTNAAKTTLSDGSYTDASYYSTKTGQADITGTGVVLDDNTEFDLSEGLSTGSEGIITLGGEEKNLNNDLVTGIDLTVSQNVGDASVTVGAAVKLSSATTGTDIVLSNSNLPDVSVAIPDETAVLAPVSWNGKITPPKTSTSVAGNAPSGFSVGEIKIEVGSPDSVLLFNKAVKITLTGVTGTVAYKPSGSDNWKIITTQCNTETDYSNISFPNECYYQSGNDTIIWTYHFTTFGSLTKLPLTFYGEGGGPPPPSYKTGDIDKNNKIDISDINVLMINWGDNPANPAADLDSDGKVDIFDFNLLMINWG